MHTKEMQDEQPPALSERDRQRVKHRILDWLVDDDADYEQGREARALAEKISQNLVPVLESIFAAQAEQQAATPPDVREVEDRGGRMKFRKKPVEIGAIRHRSNVETVGWMESFTGRGNAPVHSEPALAIHTPEGVMHAALGDWVIRGMQGEFYPCKPDIFEQTYEPVVDGETVEGQANTCHHGSASGVDISPIGPDKVWRCDHCGLCWTDESRVVSVTALLHAFDRASGMCRCGEGPFTTAAWLAHYRSQDEPTKTTPRPEGDIREIAARARDEERADWSSWLDNWIGAVGPTPPTVEQVAAALRPGRPRPFGVAASAPVEQDGDER